MNPFVYTESVVLELSGFCNLAYVHAKCPASLCTASPVMLDTALIIAVLDDLAKHDYCGILCPSVYNEPLLDPRLFLVVEYAKRLMPQVTINIWTNGLLLTRGLAEELHRAGVSKFFMSPYGALVETLIMRFEDLPYVEFTSGVLDDRLGIYDSQAGAAGRPCNAPLRQLVVTRYGDLALCCMDWQYTKTFGSLRDAPLSVLANKDEVWKTYHKLIAGVRDSSPCNRCRYSR